MKKLILSLCLLGWTVSQACTNLIVGKKATTDGSVLCSYCCDGAGYVAGMTYTPPSAHEKGEQWPIYLWRTNILKGTVEQVDYTYGVLGYFMNEHQLTILETTFGGRPECQSKNGILQYRNMMQLALQRCKTAREAIKVMTDLVEKHGYISTGESITICDKEEAWIMEIIGKGEELGAVWVAVRIPDDCIAAHANVSRIRQFPLKDKENCMYAKDVITYARKKGYFSGKDEDFSFRDAYCPIDFEKVRYADGRVWSYFNRHSDKGVMDKYLPYINGDFKTCDHMPLYIKPNKQISLEDLKADTRDHYENTPLDMTADVSAGPWKTPARPMAKTFDGKDGNKYFYERPIATPKTEFCMVCHIRGWLPDEVGGICYFNCDDASMVPYVPVYCCTNKVPYAFDREKVNYREFDEKTAFWVCNWVSNMVYPRYSVMMPDVKEAMNELESYYAAQQQEVEKKALSMTNSDRVRFLTDKSNEYTDLMMNKWSNLARFLIVKHNDMLILPSENGKVTFKKASQAKMPVFDETFGEMIIKETGDRYKVKN